MRFSNPRAFEIPDEEFKAQQEQLADLRDAHYRQLVESGAAERIIGSPCLTNMYSEKSSLTEGTLLYPFRRPIWNLSLMQSEPIYHDAGIPQPRSMRDSLLPILGDRNTENYVLYVGRHEPQTHGYSTWGYAAGVILDSMSAVVMYKEERIPFTGVQEADIALIEQQLTEIAATAQQKKLAIIDPLTLAEGHGQIIGYDDEDF